MFERSSSLARAGRLVADHAEPRSNVRDLNAQARRAGIVAGDGKAAVAGVVRQGRAGHDHAAVGVQDHPHAVFALKAQRAEVRGHGPVAQGAEGRVQRAVRVVAGQGKMRARRCCRRCRRGSKCPRPRCGHRLAPPRRWRGRAPSPKLVVTMPPCRSWRRDCRPCRSGPGRSCGAAAVRTCLAGQQNLAVGGLDGDARRGSSSPEMLVENLSAVAKGRIQSAVGVVAGQGEILCSALVACRAGHEDAAVGVNGHCGGRFAIGMPPKLVRTIPSDAPPKLVSCVPSL